MWKPPKNEKGREETDPPQQKAIDKPFYK